MSNLFLVADSTPHDFHLCPIWGKEGLKMIGALRTFEIWCKLHKSSNNLYFLYISDIFVG